MDILIPCKGFARGKSRLSPALTPAQRRRLCRAFLLRTLEEALATGARVAVVTENDEVAALARHHGALAIPDPEQGLNAALEHGNARLGTATPLIVIPTDLPGLTAEGIVRHRAESGVVIVADHRGEGTNLLAVGTEARSNFAFAFGPGSCDLHRRESERLGLPVLVRRDPVLSIDIDTPADLARWPGGTIHTAKTQGRAHATA